MISKLILIIFFCLLSIVSIAESKPNRLNKQYCLVKSYKFKDEYLHSYKNSKLHVNIPTKKTISNFDQLKWIFEPIEWLNNSYFIRNVNNKSEYLCAKDNRNDFFKSRRPVYLKNINQPSVITNEKCIWTLGELEKNGKYVITNSYFNEPLFPSSSFIANRKLYTWNYLTKGISYYMGPDLDQFIWYIYCSSVSNFKYTKKY